MKNYYNVLQISPESELIDIKRAYRKLALKYHPDKNWSNDAAKVFIEINEAYQVLSDPQKREKYDIYYNFQKTKESAQAKTEVEIFTQECTKQGSDKAKEYSKMPFEEYRKFLIRELGLKISYIPNFIALGYISFAAISFIVVAFEALYKKLFSVFIFSLLVSLGLLAILKNLYKNGKVEYKIDKQKLKTKN